MQFFPFRAIGVDQPFRITYDEIISAMNEVSLQAARPSSGRSYAVMNTQTGETFSPKAILRMIIGEKRFFGGKGLNGANRPFQAFGFPVGKRDILLSRRKNIRKREFRVLPTETLLKQLFSRKWKLLPMLSELRKIKEGSFPGVYMLAFSEENLSGRRIREKDVFYVGMTCEAGLSTRLSQFRLGISRGGFHSGADRFYKLWLKKQPYNAESAIRLYFAYLPIECENDKPWRSPEDIVRLSRVPELELAAIARVKSHLHHEPLLNKK